MIEEYPPRRIEEFASIRAYRWVDGGAKRFIDSARALSIHILGEELTAQLPVEGEEDYLDAGYPYVNVYDAANLQLEMFTRREPPETRPESRFSNAKNRLRKGVPIPTKHLDRHRDLGAVPPLTEVLSSVQNIKWGISDEELQIDLVGVGFRFASDVKNGQYELTLIPDVSKPATKMLLEQARYIQSRIAAESRKIAYPNNNDTLEIPFASVRELPNHLFCREADFHRELRGLLKVTMSVGRFELK